MSNFQSAILASLPKNAIFMEFDLAPDGNPVEVLAKVQALAVNQGLVVGLGRVLISAAEKTLDGLRAFQIGRASCRERVLRLV